MAIYSKKFFLETILTTSFDAALYTVGPHLIGTGKQISVTNYTAGAVTLTVCRVPSGGSASEANAFIDAVTIPAKGVGLPVSFAYLFSGKVFNEGDTIWAKCSANTSLILSADGYEETV